VEPPLPSDDLDDLYENAPCGYLSLDASGRIVRINATLLHWSGRTAEQVLGRPMTDLLTPGSGLFLETRVAPALRMQGLVDEIALELRAAHAERLPVTVSARERRGPDGDLLFTRYALLKTTARRSYERGLIDARDASESRNNSLAQINEAVRAHLLDEQATSALREQFIAVLSHDLRNPLASIDSGVRLLLRTPVNDKAQYVLGMMQQSSARMSALINDVMDLARGRLGSGLSLEIQPNANVAEVLHLVIAELQTGQSGPVITSTLSLVDPVACDTRRICQLVSNLLANALTHGASDQPVTLDAKTHDGWFELSVTNGGTAIPSAILARIFEPFSRGQDQSSNQGLGLGLYIAHEIARAHRGSLDVVSYNAETRFTFRMPIGSDV